MMLPKLPFNILLLAVRSTVPAPALALSEPKKLIPAPDDLSMTLPAVAVIDEPPLELSAPAARVSKLPVAVALEPVKLSAPALFRNTPVEAFAVTLAVDTVSRPAAPVPMEPPVEVRFN